jgi:hypothetical protein
MSACWRWFATLMLAAWLGFGLTPLAMADEAQQAEMSRGDGVKVMEAFARQDEQQQQAGAVAEHTKKVVMFLLGVPLVLLLIATGVMGVGMAVYGKPWFIPHMICAGLSITLALAHAVVGMVWFYPF